MNDRKLLAIVFIDVVGFTKMASENEANALFLLNNAVQILKATVKRYQGRWLKQVGDGSLCSFDSAVNAVLFAQEVQRCFSMNEELQLRIGIHIGDVVVTDGDIYGDGVNAAARIQNEAEPGGIVVSEEVHNALASHPNINDQLLGETFLKGIGRGMNLYKVNVSQDLPTSSVPYELQNVKTLKKISKNTHKLSYIASGALFVVLMVLTVVFFPKTLSLNQKQNLSMAVLPFKNLTDSSEFDFFGQSLAEEMLNVLAKNPKLQLASRTSSFDPDISKQSVQQIVQSLDVHYLIEGSIRTSQRGIRLSANLIQGDNNKQILSKTYDLDQQNQLKLYEQVAFDYAEHIGKTLNIDMSKYLIKDNSQLTSLSQEEFVKIIKQTENVDSESMYLTVISQLETFISDHPEHPPAYAYLCRTYIAFYQFQYGNRDHIERAKSACEKAEKYDPYDYSVKLAQANLFLETGEYQRGLALVETVLSVYENRAEPWFILGDLYFATLELDKGLKAYEQGLALNANYWRPYLNLSFNLIGFGQFDLASRYLTRYVELRPKDPVGYENLGVTFLYLGEVSLADQQFSKALALSASYSNLSNIGTSKYYLGNYQEAIDYFKRALVIDEQDYRVWGNLAQAYQQQNSSLGLNEYEIAIGKAMESLSINGKDVTTLAALAYFNSAIGNQTFSELYWQRATQNPQQNFESQYYLAMHAITVKQNQQAIHHLKNSIELGYPVSFIANAPEFASLKTIQEFNQLINF